MVQEISICFSFESVPNLDQYIGRNTAKKNNIRIEDFTVSVEAHCVEKGLPKMAIVATALPSPGV